MAFRSRRARDYSPESLRTRTRLSCYRPARSISRHRDSSLRRRGSASPFMTERRRRSRRSLCRVLIVRVQRRDREAEDERLAPERAHAVHDALLDANSLVRPEAERVVANAGLDLMLEDGVDLSAVLVVVRSDVLLLQHADNAHATFGHGDVREDLVESHVCLHGASSRISRCPARGQLGVLPLSARNRPPLPRRSTSPSLPRTPAACSSRPVPPPNRRAARSHPPRAARG